MIIIQTLSLFNINTFSLSFFSTSNVLYEYITLGVSGIFTNFCYSFILFLHIIVDYSFLVIGYKFFSRQCFILLSFIGWIVWPSIFFIVIWVILDVSCVFHWWSFCMILIFLPNLFVFLLTTTIYPFQLYHFKLIISFIRFL